MKGNHKHGETRDRITTKEWLAWRSMRARCYCKTNVAFKSYGARGITVCNEWKNSYEQFILDMGRAPSPTHSLDRIDNDGNYEKANCQWATKSQQALNRRSPDKLANMMAKQRVIMERLGIPSSMSQLEKEQATAKMIMAIVAELGEILNGEWVNGVKGTGAIRWKEWKKQAAAADPDYIKGEIIDLLHFVLEMCLLWDCSAEEVYSRYSGKQRENLARYKNGY